jgi:phosphatidylserine decarboxylase
MDQLAKVFGDFQKSLVLFMRYLPTSLISRLWGEFTHSQHSRPLIKPFARLAQIAVAEAEKPLEEYSTLAEFFVRRLRPGCRPIDPDPHSIVSPADGSVTACGVCQSGDLLQVKGISYQLFSLLRDGPMSRALDGGEYLTIYLSPQDYHRVHAPLAMQITGLGYMPGALLPVNPPAQEAISDLYTQNERVMIYSRAGGTKLALVLIGAHCVGRIRLFFHEFTGNRRGAGPMRLNFDPPVSVGKGDEIAAFEMGSTVVLIFSPGSAQLREFSPGELVRVGQTIGKITEEEKK